MLGTAGDGSSGVGTPGGLPNLDLYAWHRTPWWLVWRPAWRRRSTTQKNFFPPRPSKWQYTHTTPPRPSKWQYETHGQRARAVLAEKFDDSAPAQQERPTQPTQQGKKR